LITSIFTWCMALKHNLYIFFVFIYVLCEKISMLMEMMGLKSWLDDVMKWKLVEFK
jgi:hypothetical protein